jgi:hypothetical protein
MSAHGNAHPAKASSTSERDSDEVFVGLAYADPRFVRARLHTDGAAALWDVLPEESKDGNHPGGAWLENAQEKPAGSIARPLASVHPIYPAPSPTSDTPPVRLAGQGVRLLVKVEGHRMSVRGAVTALGWQRGSRLRVRQEGSNCWSLGPARGAVGPRDLFADVMDDRGRLAFSEETGKALGLQTWEQAFVVVSDLRLLIAPVAGLMAA